VAAPRAAGKRARKPPSSRWAQHSRNTLLFRARPCRSRAFITVPESSHVVARLRGRFRSLLSGAAEDITSANHDAFARPFVYILGVLARWPDGCAVNAESLRPLETLHRRAPQDPSYAGLAFFTAFFPAFFVPPISSVSRDLKSWGIVPTIFRPRNRVISTAAFAARLKRKRAPGQPDAP